MTSYDHTIWRLIQTPIAGGAWNMAVDEAILEAVSRSEVQPTLRLYSWRPPCLSLGYAQPFADVDQAALEANGWEVVRRPTGGRAILHTDELTYSVIAPVDEPRLSGGVLESYRALSQALLYGLNLLGIPANSLYKPDVPQEGGPNGPVCFEVPSNYEITVDGKKLLGSAQARRKDGVLQHGSLPLQGDLTRITRALVFPDQTAREAAGKRLLQRATTVESILSTAPAWETITQAFSRAFEQMLNLELRPESLTPGELARAGRLVQEKYILPEWTQRV